MGPIHRLAEYNSAIRQIENLRYGLAPEWYGTVLSHPACAAFPPGGTAGASPAPPSLNAYPATRWTEWDYPEQERVCVRQNRLSANGLSKGLFNGITMTAALVIVLVLWIVASLIFCLALCWAASKPLPAIEASQDTGKLVPMPHPVAESNEESALCAG